jgi:hypothetical protein
MSMLVVTPAYRPDLELFRELRESVRRHFPPGVEHLVVTPERDLRLFRMFRDATCTVIEVAGVLPRSVRSVPFCNAWVNWARPVPALRGWIVQQLVKLAVAEQASERVVVLVDSDVAFVRAVDASTFAPGGRVRFYRRRGAIDDSLPRHLRWHAVARRLLGVPTEVRTPLTDYISPLNAWDPDLVRAMLRRVEDVSARPWVEAIGHELHSSEFTLYGVYVDEVAEGAAVGDATEDSLCATYWGTTPLTHDSGRGLTLAVQPQDVAVMVSAKADTPLDVRRGILAEVRSG